MLQEFYRPGTYVRNTSLGFLLKRVQQSLMAHADLSLCKQGLTHAQWGPLLLLRVAGPCSVAKLVEELNTDAGAMTRLLDRLEAKGLCQRERSSEDRRVVMLTLTDEGLRITGKLTAVLTDTFNAHLQGFSQQEFNTLIELLQRMIVTGDALKAEAATTTPSDESSAA